MDDPVALAAQLVTLLDVEEIDTDLYRGARNPGGVGRVFGGQVIGQALQAASRSIVGAGGAEKIAHSLHAYFMRPGDEAHPILYRVVRDFEGRSFANARVIAMQKGQAILNMAASFHVAEEGMRHQDTMPDVPPPDALEPDHAIRNRMRDKVPAKFQRLFLRSRPIEIRPVAPTHWTDPTPRPPVQHGWFRVVAPIGDDMALHRTVLAYASDMMLLGTCMLPHGINWMMDRVQTASLDHALWLHEPFRADQWLLYTTDSPWAGHARGFNRGRIFTADGRLVASVAQEGLVRVRG